MNFMGVPHLTDVVYFPLSQLTQQKSYSHFHMYLIFFPSTRNIRREHATGMCLQQEIIIIAKFINIITLTVCYMMLYTGQFPS